MESYYQTISSIAPKHSLRRGKRYFEDKAIIEVRTCFVSEIIMLSVEGNYGDYEVSLPILHLMKLEQKNNSNALLMHSNCTCEHFHEGNICKHIVAGCLWLDRWGKSLIPHPLSPGETIYERDYRGKDFVEAKFEKVDNIKNIQEFLQGKGNFYTELLIYNKIMPFLFELDNLKPKKVITLLEDSKYTNKLIETNPYLKTFCKEWQKQIEQNPEPFIKAFNNNTHVYGSRALLFLYFTIYPKLTSSAKIIFLTTIYEALHIDYLGSKPLGHIQNDSMIEPFIKSSLVTQEFQNQIFKEIIKKQTNPPSIHQKNLACLLLKENWIIKNLDSFSNQEIKELQKLNNIQIPTEKIDKIFYGRLTDRVNFLKTNRYEYENISAELHTWQESVTDSENFTDFIKYAKTSHPKKQKFQEMLAKFI